MRARELVALVACVLVALVGGDAYAYAVASKACAPGTAIPEARDQREGRDMAENDDTAKAAGGKKRTPSKKHAEEIERWADELRAAARAGDLETMRRTFGALVGTVKDAFPQPSWEAARAAEERKYREQYERETDPELRRYLERYLGTGTELGTYEPRDDEPGGLAARIADGEARVPWAPPHPDLTADDFEAGQMLVREVVDAFGSGDREVLDRLRPAYVLLADLPDTKGAEYRRLARYLTTIERYVARTLDRATQDARAISSANAYLRLVREDLTRHHAAFANLAIDDLRFALDSASPRAGNGRGNRGAPRVAAELAVKVRAFDAVDETAFAKELTSARAKGKKPGKS